MVVPLRFGEPARRQANVRGEPDAQDWRYRHKERRAFALPYARPIGSESSPEWKNRAWLERLGRLVMAGRQSRHALFRRAPQGRAHRAVVSTKRFVLWWDGQEKSAGARGNDSNQYQVASQTNNATTLADLGLDRDTIHRWRSPEGEGLPGIRRRRVHQRRCAGGAVEGEGMTGEANSACCYPWRYPGGSPYWRDIAKCLILWCR